MNLTPTQVAEVRALIATEAGAAGLRQGGGIVYRTVDGGVLVNIALVDGEVWAFDVPEPVVSLVS